MPKGARELAAELLTMDGVNFELGPWLKMTAPPEWQARSFPEWPENQVLFSSKILLLGFIPFDSHWFKFESVGPRGFSEQSSNIMNRVWAHQRSITTTESGTLVRDEVRYQSKISFVGALFLPIYKLVFANRHRRLKSKYAKPV